MENQSLTEYELLNIAQNFLRNPSKDEFETLRPYLSNLLIQNKFHPNNIETSEHYNFLGALFLSPKALEVFLTETNGQRFLERKTNILTFMQKSIYFNKEIKLYQSLPFSYDPIDYSLHQNYFIAQSMGSSYNTSIEEPSIIKDYQVYKKYWEQKCDGSVEGEEIKAFLHTIEMQFWGKNKSVEDIQSSLNQIIDFENKQDYALMRFTFYRFSSMMFLSALIDSNHLKNNGNEKSLKQLTPNNARRFSREVKNFDALKRHVLLMWLQLPTSKLNQLILKKKVL